MKNKMEQMEIRKGDTTDRQHHLKVELGKIVAPPREFVMQLL